jgi:hypothetical protein
MATRTKTTHPVDQENEALKPRDFLSFSSAVAAVVATAIFYFSGWIYVSTWYNFYGLNAAQLQIPTQVVLVNGLPGIITAILVGYLVVIYLTLVGFIGDKAEQKTLRFPVTLFGTVILSFVVIFNIIILIMLGLSVDSQNFWTGIQTLIGPKGGFEINTLASLAVSFAGLAIIAIIAGSILLAWIWDYEPQKKILKNKRYIRQITETFTRMVRSPQLWLGIILGSYFVIAIYLSYFLAEVDARRGGQIMSSNWKIPGVILFSENRIPGLEGLETQNPVTKQYQYQPLGLIYKNDSGLYLVSWKAGPFYSTSPDLYYLPQDLARGISIEIKPANDVVIYGKSPSVSSTPQMQTPAFGSTPSP